MQSLPNTLPRLWPLPTTPRVTGPAVATVFLPKEHGSWSLAFEPLALAMLLAPSLPGGALLAACLAGFFCRRPFRAAFASEHSERRLLAREALVTLSTLVVAGGFEVLVLGEPAALWPIGLAVPFAALFAHFDAQGEGRAMAAELSGSAAFAVLPMTFALLAGWSVPAALGLAGVALARSAPAILTIRTFLRQRKGERVSSAPAMLASGLALGATLLLASTGTAPWLAGGATALLLARTVWLTGPWRPQWSARHVGILEAIIGLGYLLVVVGAYTFASPGVR